MKIIESDNVMDHILNIQNTFSDLIHHLRHDAEQIKDERAKAMFETSAEVIQALSKTFDDYSKQSEAAWK